MKCGAVPGVRIVCPKGVKYEITHMDTAMKILEIAFLLEPVVGSYHTIRKQI
jgi:hypothetical protein